uniref:ABC transporter n=1 Tax=Brevibacillus texasporus TaxID=327382 RepID=Q2VQ11_9BACL|nr:ABC transporter [Brevibacillus texasporus]
MAVIELKNLTKKYNEVYAVDHLNIEVPQGHIYAFLGSNGAGKTTTIKMMTGQLNPSEGEVLFLGRNIWQDREARRIAGYAPDVPLLHEGLTVREMVRFVGALYGSDEDLNKRVDTLLEHFELADKADQLIKEYSLGMKRKVSIACALIHRPKILLLDEVTNGLDPKATREVKNYIRHFAKEEGGTVFITTHILDIVEELADTISILHKGKIKVTGSMEELRHVAGNEEGRLEDIFLSAIE